MCVLSGNFHPVDILKSLLTRSFVFELFLSTFSNARKTISVSILHWNAFGRFDVFPPYYLSTAINFPGLFESPDVSLTQKTFFFFISFLDSLSSLYWLNKAHKANDASSWSCWWDFCMMTWSRDSFWHPMGSISWKTSIFIDTYECMTGTDGFTDR